MWYNNVYTLDIKGVIINIELSIIKYILNKEHYNKISSIINIDILSNEIRNLYRTIENYYKDNEDSLTVDDLANLVFASQPKDPVFYQQLFEQLKTVEVGEHSVTELAKSLKRAYTLRKLAETAYEASEGKKELVEAVKGLYGQLEELDNQQDAQGEWEFVTDDLNFLLSETYDKPGLRWRLQSLNHHLGSIRKGDFGFVFARPETGKTTFLVSEISHMAEQLYQSQQGPVLHLNNEEQNNKVKVRYIQATLASPLDKILANRTKAEEVYKQRVGNHILIPNVSSYHRRDVERLCASFKPGLIVFDQIDKINGFDDDRDDLKLGAIYQWARELAKEYAPIIGVCQSDGSGENCKWLTMANVANAKTSKQAEADWILGIGKIHDPGYEKLRFLHLSKNKLMGDADTKGDKHGRWEVIISPETARYKDIG